MSAPPIVIIAEPDPMISNVLRVEFSHLDFTVLMASSGPEVEEYASHTLAHLIVLDAKLHLGAYDACARIRRREGYANRPIVLTSSKTSPAIEAAADRAGATALLAKPYSVADLFKALTPSLPPDDLLLTRRARSSGMGEPREWVPSPELTWRTNANSGLAGNAQVLPIVRGKGVKIPLYRMTRES
jgi:CheY-like chemotaxis protein